MSSNSGNSLAKFAFNIYGALNQASSSDTVTSPSSSVGSGRLRAAENYKSNRLIYSFDKEVTTLSQLFPLQNLNSFDSEIATHAVVGGRNCLRVLALNEDQSRVLQDINLLEPNSNLFSNSRVPSTNKLNSFNTIKCCGDTIACGLSNGLVSIYKVGSNGKSKLMYKLSDHKRCINSLDFLDNGSYGNPHQLISGSQDGSIKLWDLRSASPRPVLTISSNSHSDPIRSCQYSPHSQVRNKITILSVHDSGALCKFDLRSNGGNQGGFAGQPNVFAPDRKWNLHTGPALSLHIHPEKEIVLTGGRDQKMCVWNYREQSLNTSRSTVPEHMVNTYGPVKKVRWNGYSENANSIVDDLSEYKYEDKMSYDDRESFFTNPSHSSNPLYKYDFACSYLNDDSTITVYNLNRKYIPKEIIKSPGNKPFQNFIWAKSSKSNRRIWAITKSNIFSSFELDGSPESPSQYDISRPLDDLSSVAMAWDNDFGSMSFINQEKSEFEILDHESMASENESIEVEVDNNNEISSFTYGDEEYRSSDQVSRDSEVGVSSAKKPITAVPVASNLGMSSSQMTSSIATSPIEKPTMLRAHTHNPLHAGKSPSPIPRSNSLLNESPQMNFNNMLRPKMFRSPSQTTQDSNFSVQSPIHSTQQQNSRKLLLINHASPYIVPLSLPIPANDSEAFEALSSNYLISIPDGFSLMDVCLLNASAAASVHQFRECQIWRVLAASLEEHTVEHSYNDRNETEENYYEKTDNEESKSILSDIGNFVGSYNSNSTSTTNYGGGIAGNTGGKNSSESNASPPKEIKLAEHKNGSNTNLVETIIQNRGQSNGSWPVISRANSVLVKNHQYRIDNDNPNDNDNENAISDDENNDKITSPIGSPDDKSVKKKDFNSYGNSPVRMTSPIATAYGDDIEGSLESSPKNSVSESIGAKYSFSSQQNKYKLTGPEDPDNENLNILHNAASGSYYGAKSIPVGSSSPNYFNQNHNTVHSSTTSGSFASRRNSSVHGFQPPYRTKVSPAQIGQLKLNEEASKSELKIVPETPEVTVTPKSELTRGLINRDTKDDSSSAKAWTTPSLLKKTLEYASNQGNIVLCATLTILLYDVYSKEISKESALDWLALYVDILHRKQLFVTASNVINSAPKELLLQLKDLVSKEVDLRFYCSYCEKLLINEKSKQNAKDDFGYWYCDECSRKQPNCIYCHEPCKGLVVTVSLKCGHRGHYGCLKEWFIVEENPECPGGCDYSVV